MVGLASRFSVGSGRGLSGGCGLPGLVVPGPGLQPQFGLVGVASYCGFQFPFPPVTEDAEMLVLMSGVGVLVFGFVFFMVTVSELNQEFNRTSQIIQPNPIHFPEKNLGQRHRMRTSFAGFISSIISSFQSFLK